MMLVVVVVVVVVVIVVVLCLSIKTDLLSGRPFCGVCVLHLKGDADVDRLVTAHDEDVIGFVLQHIVLERRHERVIVEFVV